MERIEITNSADAPDQANVLLNFLFMHGHHPRGTWMDVKRHAEEQSMPLPIILGFVNLLHKEALVEYKRPVTFMEGQSLTDGWKDIQAGRLLLQIRATFKAQEERDRRIASTLTEVQLQAHAEGMQIARDSRRSARLSALWAFIAMLIALGALIWTVCHDTIS